MDLDAKIEAILYYRAEPVKIKELALMLGKKEWDIKEAIRILESKLGGRGLTLIHESDSVELRTSREASSLIESMIKTEESKELTKSALETLSIILYRGPITRRDIDFIRGVNSSFILRTLLSRGLIRRSDPVGRENIYEASTDLFSHLGISSSKDLPEYESIEKELNTKVDELMSIKQE